MQILHNFADACARFGFELQSQLRGVSAGADSTSFQITGGEAEFAAAPEWIRREYSRPIKRGAVPEDMDKARRRLARNKIVLKLWEADMTQKELAKRSGLAPNSISRILKDPERTRVDTLRKIAAALDVDISEII